MSDFCYTRPMFDRVFRQAELMDRMMGRVGVDPIAAARVDKGMAWYEARTKCIACCSERQCRDWLARSEAQAIRSRRSSVTTPSSFCIADKEYGRDRSPL